MGNSGGKRGREMHRIKNDKEEKRYKVKVKNDNVKKK